MTSLYDFKVMLGMDPTQTSADDRLLLILDTTSQRLSVLLGEEPPATMDYIILEVGVNRFNRLGSEGLSSHSVEGESLNFYDDDFAPYMGEIKAYQQMRKSGTGRVRFL